MGKTNLTQWLLVSSIPICSILLPVSKGSVTGCTNKMLLLKAANTLFPGQTSYPSVTYHVLVFWRISRLTASIYASYTYAQSLKKK